MRRTEMKPEIVSKLLEVTESLDFFMGPAEGSASNILSGIAGMGSPSVAQDGKVGTHAG